MQTTPVLPDVPAPSAAPHGPLILAPAGNRRAFLAALAAGADAVYCGLKRFSARMEAKNFTVEELTALTRLAHTRGVQVYVTLNVLLKPGDLDASGGMLAQLAQTVRADGVIVQDLGAVALARQAGFRGQIHLSTLANVSTGAALPVIQRQLGVERVVVPRELNIDEIKRLAAACPPGMGLEAFVHGALCYGVSGRCYWSSFLGGKSGLRGRCVQPCRRLYAQAGGKGRLFACQDLSLDVLVKVLKTVPQVATWKIEGRKKGPHYVYYTVRAYRTLRDHGQDPALKKAALEMLAYALGRAGTHYNFLPQRPQAPVQGGAQTASGLFVGRVKGGATQAYVVPTEPLLSGDVLRVGVEDEPWHRIERIRKFVPARGKFQLRTGPKRLPPKGTPVFLTDRRAPDLESQLDALEAELAALPATPGAAAAFHTVLPRRSRRRLKVNRLAVQRYPTRGRSRGAQGLWLSETAVGQIPRGQASRFWWWLPPVTWPSGEEAAASLVARLRREGARTFVLNTPWQAALFTEPRGLNLWAGPFCNASNALAVEALAALGFGGVIVSPELGREDYLVLPAQSPLPLGIVTEGFWPLCVSRTVDATLKIGQPFSSPRGEQAWVSRYEDDFWVFPNWRLDLVSQEDELTAAGYSLLVGLQEPLPPGVTLKARAGLWNWRIGMQ